MNEIFSRRSIRSYKSLPVEKNKLSEILRAGTFAPSAMNNSDRQFTAIADKEILKELNDAVADLVDENIKARILQRNGGHFSFHYGSPVLIIVSHFENALYPEADCAVALENMFIAAEKEGLCTCWINQLNNICDHPLIRSVLTKAGVNPEHKVYGCAALGYSDAEKTVENKKFNKIVICD